MKNFVFLWSVTVLVGSCSFLLSAGEKVNLSNDLERACKVFFMMKGANGAIKHCIPSIPKNSFISDEDIHYQCILCIENMNSVVYHPNWQSIHNKPVEIAKVVASNAVVCHGVRKAIDIGLAGANKISSKIRDKPLINTKEHADTIENVKSITFILLMLLMKISIINAYSVSKI